MKTPEELNNRKEEAETVNRKLHELSDDDLVQVTGGVDSDSSKDLEYTVDIKLGVRFM